MWFALGLLGRKEKERFGERVFGWFARKMPVENVARAMVLVAQRSIGENTFQILENADIDHVISA